MPIVDIDPPGLTEPVDTARTFTVTPGMDDLTRGSEAPARPSWGATFGAGFRQDNIIGAGMSSNTRGDFGETDPTYNPWSDIKGTKYEPNWSSFAVARNPAHTAAIKLQIDQETDDRRLLANAPWYQSLLSQGAAGVLDLPTLIPGGAFVRGAKGGFSIAQSAIATGAAAGVATGVQETVLQNIQETRPLSESAVNVGASIFLGGLLGAGGAKLLSDVEWRAAVQALDADVGRMNEAVAVPGSPSPASAGAAATGTASLADNAIAGRVAGALAASTSRLNPALRLLESPSPATREVGTQLFENSLYLKKNFDGVASEPAVETLMKEWNSGLAKSVMATNDAYPDYRKAGGQLSASDFRDAVGRSMRRGDDDPDPFVAKVAKEWRANVFEPLKKAAIEARLLPEDVSVTTATSYFSRMWNHGRLIAEEPQFKGLVTDYYAGAIRKEFIEASQNSIGRIAKLDQEIADLSIPADRRLATMNDVDRQLAEHEAQWPSLSEAADQLSELRGDIIIARRAGKDAEVARLKEEEKAVRARFPGDALQAFTKTRADLRARQRNVDLSASGLQERSDRIFNALEDLEESNLREMDRLVKKGQKLEDDLGRLDADAREEKISALADRYGAMSRRAEASAERSRKAIETIKQNAERGTERNATEAARATTEAKIGAPEEAAAKLEQARMAAERNVEKRAARDKAIQERLEKEAVRQVELAEELAKIEQRLRAAADFDHDGLMMELKAAIDRATREASARSMDRGQRAVTLGERLAAVDPRKVDARISTIQKMKSDVQRTFSDRWEIRNLGENLSSPKEANFSEIAKTIANEAFNSLTGKINTASVRPEFMKITSRGPMKDRTLNIPDELVERWLENDVELVGRRYVRVMGADVELARKFGSPTMEEQLAKVREDYARLRAGMSDEKALAKLSKAEEADIRDLEALRDLLRGTRQVSKIEENYSALMRSANHVNYIRSMGEVVLASLTDAVRPAMVHGIVAQMGGLAQLATNMKAVKLSVAEAQLAGNVAETVLGTRLATISEIVDPYASRGPVEAFLENMTNVASNWNGIRIWTDWMKSAASVLTQNRILAGARTFDEIKPKERAYLAYLGIDESMAGRIAKQFGEHGETVGGVRVANTDNWTDPVAVRTYRAAINKDVDSIIIQKSVADVPLFASTPTGRALLQFKSFALASHQKVLLRGLQEDQTRFIGGMIAMSAVGMFITYAKAVSGNRAEAQEKMLNNPGWWAGEGFDRSGIVSVPMELANTFEKAAGFNPIKAPFRAFDSGNAISQKNQNRNELGSLLGPTAGMVGDVLTLAGAPKKAFDGEEVTKAQKNAATRLLPFNSYAGIRQMLNYLVNPPQ